MISLAFTSFDLTNGSVITLLLGLVFVGFVISSVLFGQHDHNH